MAEEFQRNRLYEYKANSNLVLEADHDSRRRDEPSGEVESLYGKLGTVRMGDRVLRGKEHRDPDIVERLQAKQKRANPDDAAPAADAKKKKTLELFTPGTNILSASDELESVTYRPRTRETKAAYEELLGFVQSSLGDQPEDIIKGAAEEALVLLKDESLRDPDRQREISKFLPRLTIERFGKLVSLGKQIVDFHSSGEDVEEDNQKMDEEMGVAVVFEDEEDGDEDEQHGNDDENEEEEEEEGGTEAHGSGGVLRGQGSQGDEANDQSLGLSPQDVDAHWLQRQLSKFYSDANVSSKLADEVLSALQITDERSCENRLVVLLDYDKFDFIKLLLSNRHVVYYCTRLRQAQSEADRKQIEEEMILESSGAGAAILQKLTLKASAESWAKDRMGEITTRARKEARALSTRDADANEVDDDETIGREVAQPAAQRSFGSERLLDLDSLRFAQGSHYMSNTRCELPEKSWRAQKKGYEEVHVPAVRPIIPSTEKLVEISDLPAWAQPAFAGLRHLNRIQSKMMSAALMKSDNLLLCAPTGAGKTNVALLCMLNEIGKHLSENGSVNLNAFKMVYIAPMKALVQECVLSFSKKLQPFGITVRELSGDQNLSRQQIQETQLIVTTPEKWDIITRKAGDRTYTQMVRLMIIDEIHLLHDDRGPVLESLISRTIRQIETSQDVVRLIGLSATLPNFEDVAAFLRVEPEKGLFFFDNSFRPVPLQQQYIGITERKALKRFQLMNEICYEKVLQLAGRNQVLIFTHSRAETAKTAKAIRDMAIENDTLNQFVREDSASKEILRVESEGVKNLDLKDLLPCGFAIHHAGMARADRTLVEDLFADRHIQVLVSTATLAWGVNLPCHTVIIKGTQMYSPEQGRWVELSPMDIMQMMGRAGRYGLDSEGEGIIMTSHSELQYYLSLMNQQLPIESQMIKKLPDSLNAEIVLGNISTISEAANWLAYTYLYIRMLRNPSIYGVSIDDVDTDPTLLQRRIDLAHTAASLLDKSSLVKYDRKSGRIQVTALGRVASYFYVGHETMRVFNEYLKPTMSEIEIFRLFSLAGEFRQIHVREEEKIELSKLVAKVPIPIKEGVEEPSAKVNVLLQAFISTLKLDGFALAADMTYIQQSACRLMRALFEIAMKRNWAALAAKVLNICKMVERRCWSSQSPLRQFTSIPDVLIRKLEKNSDLVWERYYDLKPQDLGEMVKMPKMGKMLYKYVHMFPRLQISASVQPITRSLLRVDLSITPDFDFDMQVHDIGQLFWIIVENVDGEKILHYEPFMLKAQYAKLEHSVNFVVPLFDPMPPQYFIRVVSDRWLHSETVLPVSFRHLILPQKYPPPTELLDLQPLPVAALRNSRWEKLFPGVKYFNPIQTQTFAALYEGAENVLVCAPSGSGKSICGEFALLHQLTSDPTAKMVYIAAKEEIVSASFESWNRKFGELINVVQLTGETAADLVLLESGNLIMSTATHWDAVSRRWKQRKNVQNVALYILDELHLVGGADGPNLEVVASRARYVSAQMDRPVRIVGLSSSLANAKDVADWIGVTTANLFNFPPNVRPIPVDINVYGFDASHFGSRLQSMAKPMYNAIVSQSLGKPVIIFVPSRKQSHLTAIDIITAAASTGSADQFVLHKEGGAVAYLEKVAGTVSDPTLAQALLQGVAFLHVGLSRSDRELVTSLYRKGVLGVLICPQTMCWSVPGSAHMVVIMDTVSFDGHEHRYVDCSITDLLQMIGLATRPGIDDSGKAIVLCQTPKKDYLKRLLHDPLPVESHLDQFLHDHICAEVVTKTIENKQDAVDYLTWTFLYRRLTQNPNYYNVQGVSNRHLSDYLSELVENVVTDLEESKCITVEDDTELASLNLGTVASYYYIQYTTIELFASSVTAKTKLRGLLEILASSTEYGHIPIRHSEEAYLQGVSKHLPAAPSATTQFDDPATKAFILLQTHLVRLPLPTDMSSDLQQILNDCIKLLQALIDVISSQGWLKPALSAMELSQMIVQGVWERNAILLQLPHFTPDIVDRCKSHSPPVESVFDLMELEDGVREDLLQLPPEKLSDVAIFCNSYPSIEVSHSLSSQEVEAGESVVMNVLLSRDIDEDDEEELRNVGKVICPRFPREKFESWWLVVGDSNTNSMLSIKRTAVGKEAKVKLEFTAPEDPGDYNLVLYLLSDSYLGADQEFEVHLSVTASSGGMDEE